MKFRIQSILSQTCLKAYLIRMNFQRWLSTPKRLRRSIHTIYLFICILLIVHVALRIFYNLDLSIKIDRHFPPNVIEQLWEELSHSIGNDTSAVEDFGEAFMESWFEKELQFCRTILGNSNNHFASSTCRSTCRYNGSLWGVPENMRRNLIVFPFRDRLEQLRVVLPRIQQLLQEQNVCHLIVIAEQTENAPFNKGSLMNAAFVESSNWFPFHCITLHDVDLLPLSTKIRYTCPNFPRHISVSIDKFNHQLPYIELVGGILSIPTKVYLRINGFSNLYWAWGAEDDDMYERLLTNRIPVTRANPIEARFRMLPHQKSPAFPYHLRKQILQLSGVRHRLDGLNTLHYTLVHEASYFNRSFLTSQSHDATETTGLKQWLVHMIIELGKPPDWLRQYGPMKT